MKGGVDSHIATLLRWAALPLPSLVFEFYLTIVYLALTRAVDALVV